MTRQRGRILTAAVLAVALLTAGCEDDVAEPTRYTTIEDAAAHEATRDGVGVFFADVVGSAQEATGGGELRNGDSVREVVCDPLYGDRFKELEIGGSFVVQDADANDVLERAMRAWEAAGWQPERSEEDRVFLETEVGDGVRASAMATIKRPSGGSDIVAVSISARTGCLKLPSGSD